MSKNLVIGFLVAVIGLYTIWSGGSYLLTGTEYSLKSKKISPLGRNTIYELQSNSEQGHAPYGQHLVLSSWMPVRSPDDGYVVFAGYCNQKFEYTWESEREVSIKCKSNEKDHTKTKAELVRGIKFRVDYE